MEHKEYENQLGETQEISKKEVRIRYADMIAADKYDYEKIARKSPLLVPMEYEEEETGLLLIFDLTGLISFSELKKENPDRKYAVLSQAAALYEIANQYEISLSPENLYYTLGGGVKVLLRDIAGYENEYENDFLKKYKALAGSILQDKYSYADYMKGGEALLKKRSLLGKIGECMSMNEAAKLVEEQAKLTHDEMLYDRVVIRKVTGKISKISIFCLSIATAVGIGFGIYFFTYLNPYTEATRESMNAYLERNYIGVIDELKPVSIERLSQHQKYILAQSYVNSENLSLEQKEIILSALTINQNEKILDYWIYIGRLQPLEAQNLAMQLSDEELLIYAYLLDKKLTEADTKLEGEIKKERIKELEGKIEEYTKKMVETQ